MVLSRQDTGFNASRLTNRSRERTPGYQLQGAAIRTCQRRSPRRRTKVAVKLRSKGSGLWDSELIDQGWVVRAMSPTVRVRSVMIERR